jgi:hypothetical protein
VFREDAGIYAENREAGRHPHTEDEIEARIVANAADAAATEGEGRLNPPFLGELVGIFRHRVSRNLPVDGRELVAGLAQGQRARASFDAAEARREQGPRRRRELESIREQAPRPHGGTKFTRPEWLLVCLIPAVVIELFGSIAALEAAFDLPWYAAAAFAGSISAILVAAADQFGNTLASVTRSSRRWAIGTLIALVVVAGGMGIWTLVLLTESREVNTAFKALGERKAESGVASKAALAEKPASAGLRSIEASAQANRPEDAEPDLDFFIPLSVLVLLTSTVIAFRVEAAADWNDLEAAIGDTEQETETAQEDVAAAEGELGEATATQREAEYALAAHVEVEHGLLTLWISRFCAEYQRFCTLEGREPRELELPEVPTPGQVMVEILDRHRGDPTPRPASGGGSGSGRRRSGGRRRDRRPPDGGGHGAAEPGSTDREPPASGTGREDREPAATDGGSASERPSGPRRRPRRPPGMTS